MPRAWSFSVAPPAFPMPLRLRFLRKENLTKLRSRGLEPRVLQDPLYHEWLEMQQGLVHPYSVVRGA